MGSNLITDKKGIFWLLDEEAMIPGASEESFIERLSLFFGKGTTSANNGKHLSFEVFSHGE